MERIAPIGDVVRARRAPDHEARSARVHPRRVMYAVRLFAVAALFSLCVGKVLANQNDSDLRLVRTVVSSVEGADGSHATGNFDIHAGVRMTEQALRDAIKAQGKSLLLAGDLAGFDELASRFRASRERTPAGIWKLSLLYNCVDTLELSNGNNPEWHRLEASAAQWLDSHPDSLTAVVIGAKLLIAHAWTFRGNGFASSVNSAGWGPYRELIEQARQLLDAHADVANKDPEWDALRIAIANEQGVEHEAILEMADKALYREAYYHPIHYAASTAMLPKWGGSEELIQQYVSMAIEHSREKEGTQVYARIYFNISRMAADGVLNELNLTGADWPSMQQSLAEILRIYPDPFNIDTARSMACLVGDQGAYRHLGRWASEVFVPIASWDAPEWRRNCDAWAFDGRQFHGSFAARFRTYMTFLQGFGSKFWNHVKLLVLCVFVLVEGGLRLLSSWPRRSDWPISDEASAAFNPLSYPRSFRMSATANILVTRLAAWLTIGGLAVIYALTTVPWPDPVETATVVGVCAIVSAVGALLIWRKLASRIVLQPDAIEVHGLMSRKTMLRSDVAGWARESSGHGQRTRMRLASGSSGGSVLEIPPVVGEDAEFRLWFTSLPRLTEPP